MSAEPAIDIAACCTDADGAAAYKCACKACKACVAFSAAQGLDGRDPAKAFSLLHQAARGGQVMAMSALGDCYFAGRGAQQHYGKALKWQRRAAALGSPLAMTYLANYYQQGWPGQPRDLTIARRHLEAACAAGHIAAYALLAQVCVAAGAYEDAMRWSRIGASKGNTKCMNNTAQANEREGNLPEARRILERGAALERNRDAPYYGSQCLGRLAMYTLKGMGGLEANRAAAAKLYREAYALGQLGAEDVAGLRRDGILPALPEASSSSSAAMGARPGPAARSSTDGAACGWCGKTPREMSACSACGSVRYCDQRCQVHDWGRHRHECHAAAAKNGKAKPAK